MVDLLPPLSLHAPDSSNVTATHLVCRHGKVMFMHWLLDTTQIFKLIIIEKVKLKITLFRLFLYDISKTFTPHVTPPPIPPQVTSTVYHSFCSHVFKQICRWEVGRGAHLWTKQWHYIVLHQCLCFVGLSVVLQQQNQLLRDLALLFLQRVSCMCLPFPYCS